MSPDDVRTLATAIAELAARLAQDPHLHAELQRARRQFHGGSRPLPRDSEDAAERRFHEWLVLERESEVLGAVPAELPRFADLVAALDESTARVFLVLSVSPLGVEARDLQDETMYDLDVPPGSLATGDLLVGRLFAVDGNRWSPSTAAAVFRPGESLGEAFRRDVTRLELDRRLQQVEIEHLLLRRLDQAPSPTAAPLQKHAPAASAPQEPLEHLEADLDRLLAGGGTGHKAADLSQLLAGARRPGLVIGPLLDELAFETAIDIERLRELLLKIWNAYHPEGIPSVDLADTPGAAPGESLGERLVRTLDDGLTKRRDVEEIFAQIEDLAGLPPGSADDADNPFDHDEIEAEAEGDAPPDPGGDVGPLVQEYLWESGIVDGPVAETLTTWLRLLDNAALPHHDLEQVTGTDLMRLLLHVYLGSLPERRAIAVRGAFDALRQFYAWAERTMEVPLGGALQDCRGALIDQVERLDRAGVLLSTLPAKGLRASILQVEDVGSQGIGVRDDDGQDHWLVCGAEAARNVRVGDLLLAALVPGGSGHALAGLVVALPSDARALME